MTEKTGLAAGQTLVIGAGGALVAISAALYAFGVFETDTPEPVGLGTDGVTEPVALPAEAVVAAPVKAVEPPEPAETPELVEAPEPVVAAKAPEAAVEAVPETESETVTEPVETVDAPVEAPEVSEPVAVLPAAPTFDVVRIEPDGSTLVAGTAVAGSMVDILLDRAVLATAEPGSDGKFVAFVTVEPSAQARLMELMLRLGDHSVASKDQVIIAPVKPVVVAEALNTAPSQSEAITETAEADAPTEEAPQAATEVAQVSVENTASEQSVEDTTAEVATAAVEAAAEAIAEVGDAGIELPATDSVAVAAPVVAANDSAVTPEATDPADITAEAEPTADVVAEETEALEFVAVPEPVEAMASTDTVSSQGETSASATHEASTQADAAADSALEADVAEAADLDQAVQDVAQTASEASAADQSEALATPSSDTVEPVQADTSVAAAPLWVETAPTVTETPAEPAAPIAPVVIIANEDGVKVLQPASADPVDIAEVYLDAISYGEDGAVELSGRGGREAHIRAYLNNALQGTVQVGGSGSWDMVLNDVAPGIYTLRIDQVDGEGAVSSRVETPFKRETEEKIAAATQPDPAETPDTGASEAVAPPLIRAVTVQPGNTLWAIARSHYGDGVLYVRVFEANKHLIRNPDLIYPGQVFSVPDE